MSLSLASSVCTMRRALVIIQVCPGAKGAAF